MDEILPIVRPGSDGHVAYDRPVRVLVGNPSCKNCWGRGYVMVTHIAGRPAPGKQLCYCVRPE